MELLERLRQPLDRLDQVLAVGLLLERDPDRGDLTREVLGVGERARVHLAVALDLGAVAVGLAVLREQDQRRRVRGLRREREVQQDERIRVPAQRPGAGVERDPQEDEDRLRGEVAAGAEEPREPLREARERIRVVDRAARGPAGRLEIVAAMPSAADE